MISLQQLHQTIWIILQIAHSIEAAKTSPFIFSHFFIGCKLPHKGDFKRTTGCNSGLWGFCPVKSK